MRRTFAAVYAALALGAFLLQVAILPHLQVAHVRPDLLLVLCLTAGLVHGPRAGALTGLWIGLAQDLLAGRFLGLFVLTKAALGALGGFAGQRIYRDRVVVPALTAFAGTILQRLVMMGAMGLGGVPGVASPWQASLWIEAAANGLAGVLAFRLLARWERRLHHASA